MIPYNKTILCALLLVYIALSLSCQFRSRKVWNPVYEKNTSFIHVVKYKDESLKKISHWYTGSQDNWKKIMAANPAINPEKITIGTHIFIPRELLKQTTSMPEDFLIKKKKVEKQPEKIKNVEKTKKIEGFELYGPR
jgi:hypothetical protein